jgi:hypothetical protein
MISVVFETSKRSFDPDRCDWRCAKAAAMVSRRELDLSLNPAPSLVIEVNSTSSSIDRMTIYAALGVDEVWRYRDGLEFLGLDRGAYRPADSSRTFPMLARAEAARFLEMSRSMERVAWMRTFRRYVREVLAPRLQEGPDAAAPP